MAKKLIKIPTAQLIKEFDTWSSDYLHFVMNDRTVRLLKPVKWEGKKIFTKDTKHHTIVINLSSVEEIWTEKATFSDQ